MSGCSSIFMVAYGWKYSAMSERQEIYFEIKTTKCFRLNYFCTFYVIKYVLATKNSNQEYYWKIAKGDWVNKFLKLKRKTDKLQFSLKIYYALIVLLTSVCASPPALPIDSMSQPEFTSTSMFNIGDTVTYICNNPAFSLQDNITTCQADGTWLPPEVASCTQNGEENKTDPVHKRVLFYSVPWEECRVLLD